MNKKQIIKDKIILMIKNVIADDIDRFTEQIAEKVYEMFEPVSIDEPGPRGPRGNSADFLINLERKD